MKNFWDLKMGGVTKPEGDKPGTGQNCHCSIYVDLVGTVLKSGDAKDPNIRNLKVYRMKNSLFIFKLALFLILLGRRGSLAWHSRSSPQTSLRRLQFCPPSLRLRQVQYCPTRTGSLRRIYHCNEGKQSTSAQIFS